MSVRFYITLIIILSVLPELFWGFVDVLDYKKHSDDSGRDRILPDIHDFRYSAICILARIVLAVPVYFLSGMVLRRLFFSAHTHFMAFSITVVLGIILTAFFRIVANRLPESSDKKHPEYNSPGLVPASDDIQTNIKSGNNA